MGILAIFSLVLVACDLQNSRSTAESSPDFNSTAETSRREVLPGEIVSFPITYETPPNASVKLVLKTITGTNWKAAFCLEDYCFMHDGIDPLERVIPIGVSGPTIAEVKVFVPDDAILGENKTLSVALYALDKTLNFSMIELISRTTP